MQMHIIIIQAPLYLATHVCTHTQQLYPLTPAEVSPLVSHRRPTKSWSSEVGRGVGSMGLNPPVS